MSGFREPAEKESLIESSGKKIMAIIPARDSSKRVPRKNVRFWQDPAGFLSLLEVSTSSSKKDGKWFKAKEL